MTRTLVALLSALFGSSCASAVDLADERTTPPFAELVRADASLASTEGRFADERSSVYVREIRSSNPEAAQRPVLVLLNGIFSDGGTWRFNTALLARQYDLLVADLPGTGRSVDDAPESRPESDYTLDGVAARTWRMLLAYERRQPTERSIALIGHSYAGAVIVRMVAGRRMREWAGPLRHVVSAIVLIASPDISTREWSPTFVELAELSEEKVSLGASLGLLESRVTEGIAGSVDRPEAALRQEAERMMAALLDPDRRRASQLLMRRIRPLDPDGEPNWPEVAEMARDYSRVDVPTMLLWGRNDETLPLTIGEKLAGEIPGSQLVVIEHARHSVHQEQPVATANAILAFLAHVSR